MRKNKNINYGTESSTLDRNIGANTSKQFLVLMTNIRIPIYYKIAISDVFIYLDSVLIYKAFLYDIFLKFHCILDFQILNSLLEGNEVEGKI